MLTVQYPEQDLKSLEDLRSTPIRGIGSANPTRLDAVTEIKPIQVPTVVNHYQLRRVIDIYVAPKKEDLSRVAAAIDKIVASTPLPENVRTSIYGSVNAMHQSFQSFGVGLTLAVLLVYLVLVAQFRSFVDPFIIVLAVPPGLIGVVLTLGVTGTTLNVMSLMGIIMLVGIAVSNSILIVEFTHRLLEEGHALREAVALACRVRLRPVLMTSLATIIGLIPMALALGAGSEAYAPLARVIIGGLTFSVLLTVFVVPCAFLLVYERRERAHQSEPLLGTT
jgi:multidrug efflux pump subunit AcrB